MVVPFQVVKISWIAGFCLLAFAVAGTRAQDVPRPCVADELEAAAFLLGEWAVTERETPPANAATPRQRTGRSVWTRRAGGCAFVEELTLGEGDDAYRELRVLAYDHRASAWTLAVVDSVHGNLVTMSGRSVPDGLELTSAQARRGRLLLDRVSYRSRDGGGFAVRTETSADAGASWSTLVVMHYR